MKRIAVMLTALLVFAAFSAKATDFSTISTSFEIKKLVKCDRLNLSFRVWAEGDNYAEALKRLKPINNEFISFLKKIYRPEAIQTHAGYNSSKTATILITIKTDKVNSAGRVLNYISSRKFPYKTGITLQTINYSLSDKKETKIKEAIFKEALIKCKKLLEITNKTLNSHYRIGNIDINYSQRFFNPQPLIRAFSKAPASPGNFSTSSGRKIITATVRFSAIEPVK